MKSTPLASEIDATTTKKSQKEPEKILKIVLKSKYATKKILKTLQKTKTGLK